MSSLKKQLGSGITDSEANRLEAILGYMNVSNIIDPYVTREGDKLHLFFNGGQQLTISKEIKLKRSPGCEHV